MSRGTALSTLVTMLKAELGYSLDATATGKDAALKQLLSNKEQWLATELDWPFLEHRWDLACNSGSRYLNLPTVEASPGDEGASAAINFEREVRVEVLYNSRYWPVEYGIGAREYNIFNSDLQGQAMDPIQRWRFATDTSEAANANQVEIWPVPVTAQTLRFTGQRALLTLAVDADKADLDDTLLVLFCAAELLANLDQNNAQLVAGRAQERLRKVMGNYPSRKRTISFNGGDGGSLKRKDIRAVPIVAVHG